MLKLCRFTIKVKVFFLPLVYVFSFDLFQFSAAILEKVLLKYEKLAVVFHVPQTTQNLDCFVDSGKEVYKDL